MIEFQTRENASHVFGNVAVIDGEVLESSDATKIDKTWFVMVASVLESRKFLYVPLDSLRGEIHSLLLTLEETVDRWLKLRSVNLSFPSADTATGAALWLTFKPDLDNWISPFSAVDYQTALASVIGGIKGAKLDFKVDITEGFNVIIEEPTSARLEEELLNVIEQLRPRSKEAATQALKGVRKNSLVTWFEFPAPVKIACEQYLIYFAQFLEDLGVGAYSEVKEDAGRVMFSVTPKDGPRALNNIKEALEAYLNLPRNPGFAAAAGGLSDIAVSQLKANVFFLQSQLSLAQATLEAKNATIEAINFTVFQQRQLLTGSSSVQAISDSGKECESEPILGDTVHLTKYEGKFLKVDLPTILRRLKRSFGINEKKDGGESER